jgi:hypothetical protein
MDDHHFITACRHGMVHLTWGRVTARFARDEFRRLANLLEGVVDMPPPTSTRDGELRVTCRQDEDCELQMGSLVLLLSPTEFRGLARIAREAVQRLDKILASGVWDREEPEDAPPSFLEQLRRSSFSRN